MSNLKTNIWTDDTYIQTSLDPNIYGLGNLNIDGNLIVSGSVTTISPSSFNSILLNGTNTGSITIQPIVQL